MRHFRPSKAVEKLGFRSKLEMEINQQLVDSGIKFAYEGPLNVIRYTKPATRHRYLADFLLGNGIIIEAKGMFTSQDRKKHLYIKQQYPDLDIRFVFMNAKNRLSKTSKTTYAKWADNNGFLWAEKTIPQAWIEETKDPQEMATIQKILKGMKK